jgi:hypothetical protein
MAEGVNSGDRIEKGRACRGGLVPLETTRSQRQLLSSDAVAAYGARPRASLPNSNWSWTSMAESSLWIKNGPRVPPAISPSNR